MRHGDKVNNLGRKKEHRQAMLSNMATSLIMHKRITTTLAKAKVLRPYVEPLINRAKSDSTHNRRVVFTYLQDKKAVSELFREIAQKIANRPGGYTRILKIGQRAGDNAEMAVIELVDYNVNMLESAPETKEKATRRRRGTTKKKTTVAKHTEEPNAEVPEETAEADAPTPTETDNK